MGMRKTCSDLVRPAMLQHLVAPSAERCLARVPLLAVLISSPLRANTTDSTPDIIAVRAAMPSVQKLETIHGRGGACARQ